MSQRTAILNHLRNNKDITALEALGVYRVFRLAARIEELRKDGHNIVTDIRTDATGKQYAAYRLVEKKGEAA